MDIEQLRAELTRRGISFAANAGLPNLQAKLEAAIAAEGGGQQPPANSDNPQPPSGAGPEGNLPPGAAKAAEPVAPKTKAPAAPAAESITDLIEAPARYYDGLRQAKVTAGLKLEQAIEVTARQRDEDEANGVKPWETETPPEA